MTAIPARSLPPIHKTIRKLAKSKVVSGSGKVTVDLKSIVDRYRKLRTKSGLDYQLKYP